MGDGLDPLALGGDRWSAAAAACVLEAVARKPGNVHRYRDLPGLRLEQLLLAGLAAAGPLADADSLGVGRAVLESTRLAVAAAGTNANLGIALLLAPLCAADALLADSERRDLGAWRAALTGVLAGLTVRDAADAFEAIRVANPGGLGSAAEQDVHDAPTVTLLEAMRMAADRDAVARQYAEVFPEILATPPDFAAGAGWEAAIVRLHLSLMAERPDTLILRKRGPEIAAESARLAAAAMAAAADDQPWATPAAAALEAWCDADPTGRNPGATADLVAAATYVALRSGRAAAN